MNELVAHCVGRPATLEELKHTPGRRLTLRARGPERSAIVKLYQSDRIVTVAGRIAALAGGPTEPVVPEVLVVDPGLRMLVVSDVPGPPLRDAVLGGNESECHRAGAGIAAWHEGWAGKRPGALAAHTIERELIVLADRSALASREIAARVAVELPSLDGEWPIATVVHRDLYEDQVVLGERVGLVDLDDVALGPAELDVGNLLAHLDLLGLRAGRELAPAAAAFLAGYEARASLEASLLARCRRLARLRLACLHEEPRLLEREDDAP